MEKNKAAQEMARLKWEKLTDQKKKAHIKNMVLAKKKKRDEKRVLDSN